VAKISETILATWRRVHSRGAELSIRPTPRPVSRLCAAAEIEAAGDSRQRAWRETVNRTQGNRFLARDRLSLRDRGLTLRSAGVFRTLESRPSGPTRTRLTWIQLTKAGPLLTRIH
jgi:hypothetical protein